MENPKAQEPQKAPWLQRQAVGTAVSAGIGAIGGAAWNAYKGQALKGGIIGGSLVGAFASIGFAGYVYDGLFGPKKQNFVDKENDRRAAQNVAEARR